MRVHLVNPSDDSFGTGVITPRWLYVLAGATPREYGDPVITDETLEQIDYAKIKSGDVVGIGIHTGNALRGMEVGRKARELGAWVVYGGIHSTLYPDEPMRLGGAHAVVKGDGDGVWGTVIGDCLRGEPKEIYDGGRVPATQFTSARWDLMPDGAYMWASVQTVRGCPKHCSFCSVWRTDGQEPRQRAVLPVIEEIVQLRRIGYRFIALADDNFYPVTLTDIKLAEKQKNLEKLAELKGIREERFELMRQLSLLPKDMVFFTQITMEAAEDTDFLDAMKKARILGALVGVESVTPEGLKTVFKDFNLTGDALATQLQTFRKHGVHVLGSFIFGLSSDRPETFEATLKLAKQSNITFAQFVMMTPFPGTVDFLKWEKEQGEGIRKIDGIPISRYWLIPHHKRPKLFTPHPTMSSEELRVATQGVWDKFYSNAEVWRRSTCTPNMKARLAFFLISKLYRQMYANTGITTDSARRSKATSWARVLAKFTRKLFVAKPMPQLEMPLPATAPPVLTSIQQLSS